MTAAPGPAAPDPGDRPAPPDPWKGLRGVMAGTLVLEVIVVLLALPVISTVGGGISALTGAYVGVLALLMVLGAGLQRRSWALTYNLALQVLFVGGIVLDVPLGVAGIVFAFLWALILVFRRDVARRLEAGTLRSQYPAS